MCITLKIFCFLVCYHYKEVIINTRRILYVKQVNNQKSLFVMNSGYKIFVSVSLENLWAKYLLKQPFKA